jgi:copper chaperone CopZ
VDSILVTYSMLGPVFAVFRPLAAMITGVLGGWLVAASDHKNDELATQAAAEAAKAGCNDGCDPDFERAQGVLGALRYGFVSLPRDIGKSLVVGLVIAAGIGVFVPPDFAGELGSGFVGMLAMMAVGIPLYVCATGSVPIAAALILKGISPGAALVFLMTGPATNAAAISTIWKILGRRTALIYLGVVAGFALFSGWALDAIFDATSLPEHAMHHHDMGPGLLEHGSAILLVALLTWALLGTRFAPSSTEKTMADGNTWKIAVEGMNCGHCVNSVERALRETAGVSSVEVSLEDKSARVVADALDEALVREKIEQLGFTFGGIRPA